MGPLVDASPHHTKMKNPYLTAWERDQAHWEGNLEAAARMFIRRRDMVREYAWAIPNEEAIQTTSELGDVVELGAGSGYWAHLIQEAGGKIDAWDLYPEHKKNYYNFGRAWTSVMEGSVEILENSRARVLLLSWPCYLSDFAYRAIQAFRGEWLAYVGEGMGGCCADDQFFQELDLGWTLEKTIKIPQWPGIHDRFELWKRKENRG
jgi:hypothetical protein